MAPPDSSARGAAIEIFAGWLSRRESGEFVAFDELLGGHPHLAAELKELEATWKGLAAASDPSASSISLHERIKSRFGEGSVPEVSLREGEKSEARAEFSSALIAQLSAHSTGFGRYRIRGEVARGGMGAILKIWDEDLRRHLAMKVILGQAEVRASGGTPPVESSKVARFLEEAQVTGQLDHPGIVPVHELGLDPEGRLYFTMKLVKGSSLKEVFDLVAEGQGGWTQTKVLGVLLKVCEAMAYAHDKGVIHRDLKPGNIMVGKFGEVHVMDWGLARILDKPDEKDIRILEEIPRSTKLRSARDEHRGERSESPLYTMDGDVVGTPAYMPLEQAAGRASEVGPHSDVYALGAMLYHLVAGHMPYVPKGARLNNYAIWALVQQSPPTPIAQLAGETPAELVAICEKAMARDWKQRYRDMSELATDLSAYLEHRVVGAYETGTWAETKKWIERNKALAASLAAAVLLLVAGLTASLVFKARADQRAADLQAANSTIEARKTELAVATQVAQDNEKLARTSEARAIAGEGFATRKANDVLSLSAIQDLKELQDDADALWPADPENVPRYEAWLADARRLIEGQPEDKAKGVKGRPSLAEHEAKLMEVRARAKPLSPEEVASEGEVGERRTFDFEDGEDRWWHAQLSKLVADLKAFTDEKTGGFFSSGTSEEHGWGIVKRAEFARTIEERSVNGAEARRRWEQAIAAIAEREVYRGLVLTPQMGLLPIGEDPDSHLWEFAHLATGEPAERGSDGKLILKEGMGLVFVLIPGGTFRMGAQGAGPSEPNYDSQARSGEIPVHEVTLSPYFLSKYELTQGQWERFVGRNPSAHGSDHYSTNWNRAGRGWSALNPVEQVSWTQCMEVMTRLGLTLPSEAQWEYGARGGTGTPYWTGSDLKSLKDAANLADAYGASHGVEAGGDWERDFDDGNAVDAEVGSYRANPFGLHDVVGNVWEWCLDGYDPEFYGRSPKVDPIAMSADASMRVDRGGSYGGVASFARVALRNSAAPVSQYLDLGLRPARSIRPSAPELHAQPR